MIEKLIEYSIRNRFLVLVVAAALAVGGIFAVLNTPVDAEVTQLCAALTGENGTTKVAFGTEGGLFSAAGIPTIICGPGSIDQAHKPDEFVDEAQLVACLEFLGRLAEDLSR